MELCLPAEHSLSSNKKPEPTETIPDKTDFKILLEMYYGSR